MERVFGGFTLLSIPDARKSRGAGDSLPIFEDETPWVADGSGGILWPRVQVLDREVSVWIWKLKHEELVCRRLIRH
jgi:hypothetical protein